jgi:UDP-N-acetylglucosamine 1-carboxyvinyltransferase
MRSSFRVTGGRPLQGTVRPAGNKNAALPILAATLLADGPCRIDHVPRIRDVETLLELLARLGATVEWSGPNTVDVNTAGARPHELDPALCARIRASILLAGPMLARFGRVSLPPPGGDVIGRRRVDTHFLSLERLGAAVTVGDTYQLEAKDLRGADIFLDEPSVTGTENTLMAAVGARGTTVLRNAASEPHVQDLARFLVALGARIDGIGSNTLSVEGGTPLGRPAAPFTIGPDHIEVGSFIGLAAVTNGAVTIEGVRTEDLRATLLAFDRLGIRPRVEGTTVHVDADQERRIRPDLGGHVPKLEDGPWPAFPADLMSIAIVTATQCDGLLLMFEKLFESRLFFVDKLIGLGARIVLCDPHRAVIAGPSRLRGGIVESPDIRAGMAMLLAALAADGVSVINNIGQIERGYENIEARLKALGAQIERVAPPDPEGRGGQTLQDAAV